MDVTVVMPVKIPRENNAKIFRMHVGYAFCHGTEGIDREQAKERRNQAFWSSPMDQVTHPQWRVPFFTFGALHLRVSDGITDRL